MANAAAGSLGVLLIALGMAAHGAPPRTIGFMGLLLNPNGSPRADGTYTVALSLYGAPAGGAALWTETKSVTSTHGLFSTALGNTTPIPPDLAFDTAYFIGVSVGPDAQHLDPEMQPRIPLQGVPYAMMAQNVLDGSVTSAKLATDAYSLAKVSGGAMASSNGSIGIGTASPSANLEVSANQGVAELTSLNALNGSVLEFRNMTASPTYIGALNFIDKNGNVPGQIGYLGEDALAVRTGGSERVRVDGNGHVGIGTATPGFPLTFADALGDKISLWGQSGENYGFGIQGSLLQVHSRGSTDDIAFGYGSSAALTENVRFTGTGNVGIGTPSPAAKLDVRGDVRLGPSGQYFAVGGDENLRFIRGTVSSDGTIWAGSGFTVSHQPQTGLYHLTFLTPFSGTVSATANTDWTPWITTITSATSQYVEIQTTQPEGRNVSSIADQDFDFIVAGPR
jgi:hypothetical protein